MTQSRIDNVSMNDEQENRHSGGNAAVDMFRHVTRSMTRMIGDGASNDEIN